MERIIPEFPNYKITDGGVVLSNFKFKTNKPCDTWRVVQQIFDKSCGYMIVTLCSGTGIRKNKRVHRLLCEAFLPNPLNKAHVNHIDGNKLNNTFSNLEWATSQENARHAIDTGLCDERRKDQEVSVIQLDILGGFIAEHVSLHEAERTTGTAYQNIYKVCTGKRKSAGGFRWEYK